MFFLATFLWEDCNYCKQNLAISDTFLPLQKLALQIVQFALDMSTTLNLKTFYTYMSFKIFSSFSYVSHIMHNNRFKKVKLCTV